MSSSKYVSHETIPTSNQLTAFQVPKLPIGSNKRRMPDNPTPEMLKRMKLDPSQGASSSAPEHAEPPAGPSKARAATVEEVEDEEMGGTDRDFAPGGDADYFAEEDEEGRFYGGGLTSEQKEILNIFDNAGEQDDGASALTLPGIRRTLLRFERAAARNQDHRSKWPDDPTKCVRE